MERSAALQYYIDLLDRIGDRMIAAYDRMEAGRYDGGAWEDEGSAIFTFGGLSRVEQAEILLALESLDRTKRVNRRTPTSYSLKHDLERAVGVYCSNLQAKVAMRILGFERGGDDLNPRFNVTVKSCRRFHDENEHKAYKGRTRQDDVRQRVAVDCSQGNI